MPRRRSVATNGTQGNAASGVGWISENGRYVQFQSNATNLVTGGTATSMYVRDLTASTTQLVPLRPGEQLAGLNGISRDGRYLGAGVFIPDGRGTRQALIDRSGGTEVFVSDPISGGHADQQALISHVSNDGRYVIFPASATNLVPDDTNGFEDMYIYDQGQTDTTPPTITTAHIADGTNGWNIHTPVTETVTASDTGGLASGSPSCQMDGNAVVLTAAGAGVWTFQISSQGTHTVACSASDISGNTATANDTVLIDTIPPSIQPNAAPAANTNGWRNTAVAVSFTCSDNGSGIASCTPVETLAEGANQSVIGVATDIAGNTATVTVGNINIDEAPPTLHGEATEGPNPNGWYKAPVTIHWTCSDALSGIEGSCPADDIISGEGAPLTANESVSDKAGNLTTAASEPVQIDQTAPLTTVSAPSGWSNTGVTVTLNPTDNLSGVDTTSYTVDGGPAQNGTNITIDSEGAHTISFWSTDLAGNVETAKTVTVLIDKTAPTISHQLDSAANGAGWNNTSVTVTFICSDSLSGIASCTSPKTLTGEGAMQDVHGVATDNAGNTALDTALVSIDETAPLISPNTDRQPNSAGWFNDQVIVSFTCSDTLSGIATCPAAQTLDEAHPSAEGTAIDAAGNSTTATLTAKIDQTKPTVTVTGVSQGQIYYTGSVPAAGCTTTDTLSGVATQATVTTTGGPTGTLTATCQGATDHAGNLALPVTVTYQVATNISTIGNGNCTGTVAGTNGGNLSVQSGATCTLITGTQLASITVQRGGSLVDQGAVIGGDLKVNSGAAITINGGSIGNNLTVNGLTSSPAGGRNSICNVSVANDLNITGNLSGAPIDIGSIGVCSGSPGVTVGNNLTVQSNAAEVRVGGNQVAKNITVQSNSGGGTLTGNTSTSGGSCKLQNNNPDIVGSGNTVNPGKTNTCNATA